MYSKWFHRHQIEITLTSKGHEIVITDRKGNKIYGNAGSFGRALEVARRRIVQKNRR